MDFSKLTIGEAREFLAYNGVQETSLDTLIVQTRALQVYTERNRTNSTVYTLIFLALDRAGRFPSTNKYTERQIINLTPEQLQIFGQYYQFDPTTPYAKQFLWRILEIQGNTLPEPPVQVIQPIQPYVAPTPNIVTNDVPVDPEYRNRVNEVFYNVPVGIVKAFIRLNSGGFNVKFDKSVTDDYIYRRAIDLYIKSVKNTGTIKDGGSLDIKATHAAISKPNPNKYTEDQLGNLTNQQINTMLAYYGLEDLKKQKYDKSSLINALYTVLKYQDNIIEAGYVAPAVQQPVVPVVQPVVVPTPGSINIGDLKLESNAQGVFNNALIQTVKEFIVSNSKQDYLQFHFKGSKSENEIRNKAVEIYLKSIRETGTIEGLDKIKIRLLHVAISKFNSNKYTEEQIRNFTDQQLNDIFTYYGLEDLKNISREDHINVITMVLLYQNNLIESQPVGQAVPQPVVQPNLINFNTVNPLIPAPVINPLINPLLNPVVMSPVKQLSPVQPLQLSPRPGPSVFTDVKMSPVKQLSANRPMSPQQTSQQMTIGPQFYTPEFAKIKNAEDELRRHYAENAFTNPRRYDASNPTYNLMDVTDKADTYVNAYKSIQRNNYVTADSIFASYAFSAIKEANQANNTPDFRKKFISMMNSIIPENLKKNLVIAGGFVLSYFGVTLKNNDIDIFIVDTDQPELILTQYMEWLTKETTFVLGRRSPFAVTIFRKDDMKRPISIILRQYKSPSEIMTGFDLDASCFCFYNGRFWTSARGEYALKNRTNTVDVDRLSPSYNYRLLKYGLNKGFRAVVPGLKKTESMARNIERNLEDNHNKTFGCVGLYALLRMEVVKNIHPSIFYTNIGEVSDYDVNMRDTIYGDGRNELRDVIKSRIHPDFKDDDQSMYFERIKTEDRDTKAIYYTKDPILLLQDNKLNGKVLSNKPVFIKENPGKQGYYTSSFHPIQTTWVEWSDINNCVPAALYADGTVDRRSTSFKKFASMPEGH